MKKVKNRKGRKRRKFWRFVGKVLKLMKKIVKNLLYAVVGTAMTFVIVPAVNLMMESPDVRLLFGAFLSWTALCLFIENREQKHAEEEMQ